MIRRTFSLLIPMLACCVATLTLLVPDTAHTAGFEVGENTAKSTARGGTGVVNTSDPSAIYFNPALLGRVDGSQVLLSSNFLTMDLNFERADLFVEPGDEPDQTFDPVTNQTGIFPAPFVTASFDLGPEEFSLAAGIYGPPAFGNPCYGDLDDGECVPQERGAARGMVVETDMVVIYPSVGASYTFDLDGDRELDIGLTASLAYQTSDFAVVAEATSPSTPWREDPNREAFIRGENLTGIAPTGILGIAYSEGPFRLAASYRPPISWDLTGRAEVDYPAYLDGLSPSLSDDTIRLQTNQAGSLRLGWGLEWGEHPADAQRPRWDLEINTIWENWSVVDHFRIDVEGDIQAQFGDQTETAVEFNPIYQRKGYQDTISLRTGLSYGVNTWMTAHGGGFLETAAQPVAYTSADFVSWERYAGSIGASFHLPHNLEFDIGYTYIHMPSRTVTNGEVYNPIPMSNCQGPDFQDSACEQPGQPPGNPQNEGDWRAHFQILSAGMTWQY